jgi:hypothetical protein
MNKERLAIVLLIILIAIGGIVMYGEKRPSKATEELTPPRVKGPPTPPPGYAAPR